MDFSGTYEMESHENYEPYMRALGVPEEVIQKGKDAKIVTKIEQNGNHFVTTVTTGSDVICNEFTLGEESEVETPNGKKVKVTVNVVDGKIVVKRGDVSSTVEVCGDCLTNVTTINGIVYSRISKRVS